LLAIASSSEGLSHSKGKPLIAFPSIELQRRVSGLRIVGRCQATGPCGGWAPQEQVLRSAQAKVQQAWMEAAGEKHVVQMVFRRGRKSQEQTLAPSQQKYPATNVLMKTR